MSAGLVWFFCALCLAQITSDFVFYRLRRRLAKLEEAERKNFFVLLDEQNAERQRLNADFVASLDRVKNEIGAGR